MEEAKRQKVNPQKKIVAELDSDNNSLLYYLIKGSFCEDGMKIFRQYVDKLALTGLNYVVNIYTGWRTPLMIAFYCRSFDAFKYIFEHPTFDIFQENDMLSKKGGLLKFLFEIIHTNEDTRYFDLVIQNERLLEKNKKVQLFLSQLFYFSAAEHFTFSGDDYYNTPPSIRDRIRKCLNHPSFDINYQYFGGGITILMRLLQSRENMLLNEVLRSIPNRVDFDFTLCDNVGSSLMFYMVTSEFIIKYPSVSPALKNIVKNSDLRHRNTFGKTILHYILREDFSKSKSLLFVLDACLKETETDIDTADYEGITPLMVCGSKQKSTAANKVDYIKMLRTMISSSKNINVTCQKGHTALVYACENNPLLMECLTQDKRVDVNLGNPAPIDILIFSQDDLLVLMKNQTLSILPYLKARNFQKYIVESQEFKKLLQRRWSPQMRFGADDYLKLVAKTLFLVRQRLGWSRFPKDVLFGLLKQFPLNDSNLYDLNAVIEDEGVFSSSGFGFGSFNSRPKTKSKTSPSSGFGGW